MQGRTEGYALTPPHPPNPAPGGGTPTCHVPPPFQNKTPLFFSQTHKIIFVSARGADDNLYEEFQI